MKILINNDRLPSTSNLQTQRNCHDRMRMLLCRIVDYGRMSSGINSFIFGSRKYLITLLMILFPSLSTTQKLLEPSVDLTCCWPPATQRSGAGCLVLEIAGLTLGPLQQSRMVSESSPRPLVCPGRGHPFSF